MIRLFVGLALGAAVIAATFYYGRAYELAQCDLRIKAAEARFEKLQNDVKAAVEEFAAEEVADQEKWEKQRAEILKSVLSRLSKASGAKCTIDSADVADARRLRRGPSGRIAK